MNTREEVVLISSLALLFAVSGRALALDPNEMLAINADRHQALNAHDLEGYFSYITEDSTYEFVDALPAPLSGKAEITGFFQQVLTAFPDFATDDGLIIAGNDTVVVEHLATGTHSAEWAEIPATGLPSPYFHVDIWDFTGDKITRSATYADMSQYYYSWGVLPVTPLPPLVPSFTPATPEATGLSPVDAAKAAQALWNAKNLADYAKMQAADDNIFIAAFGIPLDRAQYAALQEMLFVGFPDMQVTPIRFVDMGGGWVLCECVYTGTHTGAFMGMPASGAPVAFHAAIIYQYDEQGLEKYMHLHYNTLALLQQIMPPAVDIDALHEGFGDALNTQDVNGVMSYFHDDATYDYVPLAPVMEGKEQIQVFFEDVFTGYPDFHVAHRNKLISGNILITECTITGTHLGELFGIPGTGNPVQLLHMDIYEIEGDKIKHMTTYDDAASFLIQFGVMPAPDLDPALLVPSFALQDAEPTGLPPLEAALELAAIYNAHDLAGYAKGVRPDAQILLAPLGIPLNREQFIAVQELYFMAFPDLNQEVLRSIDMGDGWVLFEVMYKGTNTGPYFGIPPTQRYSEARGALIARYDADGLLTNLSVYFDNITTLVNLGLFPPPDPEANKALERRVFEEIWNQGLLDVADEVFAPDAELNLGTDDLKGPEGFKAYVAGYRAAFPDIHWTVEDQVAEGEIVVTRLTGTGTHQGELMGIPPTGLPVTVTAIATVRIAQGKIQESWTSWDALGLMQQLGVMPPSREDYTWGAPSEVTGDPGDPAANTAQVLYVVQKFWNEQIAAALDGTHSPDSLGHSPLIPGQPLNYTMYKLSCLLHLAAFPDFHVTNEDIIAEGDKVAVRWTVNGTHLGDLMGMPPTGRPVTFKGTTIYRHADGKIVENWWCYDALGMMQQITGPYCTSPPGDVNDDCKVDFADLAVIGSHWLESTE